MKPLFPIIALLIAVLCPQEPEERPPLPEGVVARIGDRMITLEEYKDFLWTRFWKRPAQDLVVEVLLENEAERYGIQVTDEQVKSKVEERLQTLRETPRQGDFEEDLKKNGQDMEMYRQTLAREARHELLQDALVHATRVVTDESLNREFEARYGQGGVRLRVRHVLIMPNLLRAEAVRAGKRPNEIDMDEMKAKARAMADEARKRLMDGEDFALVAAEMSHDQTTKDKGGELRSYNGRLYGPAFAEAVNKQQPGDLSEVVETGAGYHVVQLISRTETQLEDVREELVQAIMTSDPSWQERNALIQSLQAAADVQMW